ncbi:MAG: hypothetical protein HQL81_00055 [Magnetococcales bacterium]|nr:hypothetical protein [Magnetococcales bacterium]
MFGGLGVRSQVIYDSQAPMIGSHMLFNRTQASRSALGYFVEPYISRWRSDFNAGLTMSKTLSHGSPHDEGLTEMNAFDLQSNFEFGLFPQSRFPASFYFNRYDSSNSEGGSSGHGSSRVSQKIGLKQDYRNDTNDLSASLQGEHRNDNMGERSRPKWQTLFLPGMGNKEGTNVSDMLSLRLDKRFTKNTIGMTVRSTNNLRTTVVNTTKSRDHGATLTHGYNPKENFSVNNLVTMGLFYNDYLTRDLGNVFGGELRERMMDDQQQIGTDLFWRAMERPISLSAAIRVAQQEEEYQLGVNDDGYETNRLRRGANTRFGGMYQFNEHNTMTGYLTGNYDVIEQQDALNDMESAIASTTQVLAHQYDSPTTQWFSFDHRWYSNTSLVNSIADLMKPSQNIQERLGHGVRRIFEKNKGWGTFRTSVDESVGLNEKLPDSELAADVTHGASLGYESGSDTKPTLIDLRLMDTHTLSPEAMEQQMANLQFSRSGMKSDNGGWQGNITLNLSRLSNEDGLVTIARSGGINASVTNLGIFGVDDLRNELSSTLTSSMVSLGSIEPVYHELRIQDLLYYHIGKLTVRLGGEISVLGDDTGITSTLGLVTLEATREYHRRF